MKEPVIGRSINRIGGLPRVQGTQVYVGDVKLPNMLHAKLVHLDCAHARIRSIDSSEALKVKGVRAVLSADDLPKPMPRFGPAQQDRPLLAVDTIQFHGEPVAIKYPGTLNQERMFPYTRVDFRASRKLRVGRSDLLVYLDVFNVLNRENALDYEQDPRWTGSGWIAERSLYPQLWMMPSLGVRWTF